LKKKLLNQDDPFLPPIDNPIDPVLKQVYAMQEKYIGKVITSSKVHSARLPSSFAQFYGKVGELDRELELSREAIMLIRARVAQINICEFCTDANRAEVILESMDQAKFDALDQYGSSPLYTDAERAMLNYVTELTNNKKVNAQTFDKMAQYYSEREICEIVYVVASEHLYNITNIGLNIHSDMICDLAKKRKHS
jgi:alkylhydroperoxidase family enzyme